MEKIINNLEDGFREKRGKMRGYDSLMVLSIFKDIYKENQKLDKPNSKLIIDEFDKH